MYPKFFKRLFDLVFALLLLASLSWLGALIIFFYLITFSFPIFFIQQRVGKDEKIFKLYKFRTLHQGDGPVLTRRFWWGSILRATSLDELPQLLNILKGEMSIIGPRPLPVDYLNLYSPNQRRRHTVRPGVTGLAQVNGRHAIVWKAKFEFDLYYVDHISFLLDASIMFKTFRLLLAFKKDISLHEKKFEGEE